MNGSRKEINEPASSSQRNALLDHPFHERDFSSWSDHLRFGSGTDLREMMAIRRTKTKGAREGHGRKRGTHRMRSEHLVRRELEDFCFGGVERWVTHGEVETRIEFDKQRERGIKVSSSCLKEVKRTRGRRGRTTRQDRDGKAGR